jgi:hypothetical protein
MSGSPLGKGNANRASARPFQEFAKLEAASGIPAEPNEKKQVHRGRFISLQ